MQTFCAKRLTDRNVLKGHIMETTEQTAKKDYRKLAKTAYILLTVILVFLYIVPASGQNIVGDIVTSLTPKPTEKSPFNYQLDSASKTCQITGIGSYREIYLYIPSEISNHTVTTIGSGAFRNVTTIKSVTVPGNISIIGNHAFAYCTELIGATLNYGVRQIGPGAFYKCDMLEAISIPSSVTYIGSNALANCHSLRTIYFDGTKTQWTQISADSGWKTNANCMVICSNGRMYA